MQLPHSITQKNIRLSYILTFINNSFFWFAPWLLFLLNYITFPQAAVLQSIGLLTTVISEVPTGALADLIGKKKTLHLAFLLTGTGEIIMAFSNSYPQFIISYIILNIGYSFYSGTMEAFTYDTLVANNEQAKYNKVVSRTEAYSNAGTAISSIAGGFLYTIWIGLPFLATGITKFIGLIVSFFIDEPRVDTEKLSIKNFIEQSGRGFQHLFDKKMIGFTILLLTFGIFHVATYEIIDDITVIDYGYTAKAIGVLYAAAVVIAIPSSLLYERISRKVEPVKIFYLGIIVLGLHYIFTPWIGVTMWTFLFLMRVLYSPLRNNALSEILNSSTDSRIRATTLSTYSMMRTIPFVLLAGYIGTVSERIGIRNFDALFFGLMLVLTIPQIILLTKNKFKPEQIVQNVPVTVK